MIDYSTGENLASTIIIDGKLRVSTATFKSKYGKLDALIETFIFSEDKSLFKTKQYIHKSRKSALRSHNRLVKFLTIKFKDYITY